MCLVICSEQHLCAPSVRYIPRHVLSMHRFAWQSAASNTCVCVCVCAPSVRYSDMYRCVGVLQRATHVCPACDCQTPVMYRCSDRHAHVCARRATVELNGSWACGLHTSNDLVSLHSVRQSGTMLAFSQVHLYRRIKRGNDGVQLLS